MDSFNPVVRCPHCNGVNRPSITGWGREGLNNRLHQCKHCGEEYTVVCYVESSTDHKISDMHLSAIKSKIKYQKNRIKEMEQGLINTSVEVAKEYIRLEASTGGNQN